MSRLLIIFFLVYSIFLNAADYTLGNPWYIKGGIGVNYLNLDEDENYELEMDPGIATNLTLGHHFNPNLRSEIEFCYRLNEGYQSKKGLLRGDLKGNVDSYMSFLNLLLDLPFQNNFTFSLGGGIGVHSTHTNLVANFFEKDGFYYKKLNYKKEGICGQGIVGLLVKVSPQIHMGGEFKYCKSIKHQQNNSVTFNMKLDF